MAIKYVPRNLMVIYFLFHEFTLKRLIKNYSFDIFGLIFIQKNISYAIGYFFSILSGIPFSLKIITPKKNLF